MEFIHLIYFFAFIFSVIKNVKSDNAKMVAGFTYSDIKSLFEEGQDLFENSRHVLLNNQTRIQMAKFIENKLRQIETKLGEDKAKFEMVEFQTPVVNYRSDQEINVNCANLILTFKRSSSEESEDMPLMILANYDTKENENNPVDDNGSGVVALIILAEYLANQIANGYITLEKSVIFVAADASLGKYEKDHSDSKSGSSQIAREWLPLYLEKQNATFAGAIVLDSILNFKDRVNSQTVSGFDKTFPDAYSEMSKGQFKGDFLAMVGRKDQLDKKLMEAINEAWAKSMVQPRTDENDTNTSNNNSGFIEPRIIEFDISIASKAGEPFLHFLKSDQANFWNHHVTRISPKLPAVLLTDTRIYRSPDCKQIPNSCNKLDNMVVTKNVAFMHRTMQMLHTVIVDLQSKSGGISIQSSLGSLIVATIICIIGARRI